MLILICKVIGFFQGILKGKSLNLIITIPKSTMRPSV